MVIFWSKPARNDLHLIHQYIAHDSQRYATRVVQDIVAKVDLLLAFPRLGKIVPETGEQNVRELSLYSYRIMYEVMEETIYVHGIFHKRQHFQPSHLNREQP